MLFDRLKRVKAFMFAVDGVLTDGKIWLTPDGEQLHRLDSRDDYALQLAIKRDYPIALVSAGNPQGIKRRLELSGGVDLFFGVDDKKAVLHDWLSHTGLTAGDMLYMGSDIPDLAGMQLAGFATCPADAATEVRAVAAYISFCRGGDGAVRDVVEKVMKLQDTWL
ncbi:KdsC family phosphatase [Parapedobacter pyrenivorans]|uniref:KdsC family phosphatase n=1 Tax=Parapedobacter pyrenivorans TaxID=1305674 RepID=UPI0033419FEC